jgi:hypothetical protein
MRKLLFSLLALIAPMAPAADPPSKACADPAYRQFDFWLGDWQVFRPDGALAGTNRIAREYGGCVLHERYTSPKGYTGESLNTYDAGRKRWHQTWVDNEGLLLLLEGQFSGKSMVLEGAVRGTDGATVKHRVTWTPNQDGTVRQHWESADAKGNWKTVFDGLYRRK